MSTPAQPTVIAANPADSTLLSLARAVVRQSTDDAPSWPRLDLTDPKQREFGDYELLEELGRGGMGVVYRARQASLDRDVAIKFIADWFADPARVERFTAEARTAARLMHPHIVPVHEVGSVEGLHYFSMPLIKGRSLAEVLGGGTLEPNEAVALMRKLCEAIDYAHRLGLLHLDLKPANVLFDERNEPLVADFGLARHMDAKGGVDAQEVSGTPNFMAPEQIHIKQYRLTPATDIYALGAILYLCLTGVSPHGSGSADDVMRRAAANRIAPPRSINRAISPDLAAITMKCLELQPADRYANVAALAEDLRRYTENLPVAARPLNGLQRLIRWERRNPALAGVRFAALIILILLWSSYQDAEEARLHIEAEQKTTQAARVEAEAQRDHAINTSALGAWLYAQHTSDDYAHDRDIATRMLQWLRAKLPNDETQQAAVLTSFITALDNEKPEATDSLWQPFIEVMGRDYRQKVIAALEAGREPNRHALAARLAWFDERDVAEPKQFTTLLDEAIAAQPDDVGTWNIATTFCTGPKGAMHCRHPEAVEHLIRLDPDNAYPWLLRAMSEGGERGGTALHEAALRKTFDDYFRATFSGYVEALHKGGVPAPKLLSEPTAIMAPGQDPLGTIAIAEAASFPIADWSRLTDLCKPAKQVMSPLMREDCRTVGEMMARSKATLVTRHIGANIVRRIAKGTPLEQEMVEMRRRYVFVTEGQDRLTREQHNAYPLDAFIADITREGELEAVTNELKHYGIPTQPPADWQPKDPDTLVLAE